MSKSKKQKKQDWHRADVVAALHKAGHSIRSLTKASGYKSPTTLSQALNQPWPKGEAIIAKALNMRPQDIWPSRYDENGDSNRKRGISFSAHEVA